MVIQKKPCLAMRSLTEILCRVLQFIAGPSTSLGTAYTICLTRLWYTISIGGLLKISPPCTFVHKKPVYYKLPKRKYI